MPRPPHQYNATLSATGYDRLDVRVRALTMDFDIITSIGESRMYRTLYTKAMTDEGFGIEIQCATFKEYKRLGVFIRDYGRKAAQGNLGMMRVSVPKRGFDRMGIPNGATFGRSVRDVTWPMAITFVGAYDLISTGTRDVTALSNVLGDEYAGAIKKDPSAAYFYPVGSQLSGLGAGSDLLYNTPSADPVTARTSSDSDWYSLPSGKRVPL